MDVVFYNGAHSVIFGDKHSWNDWRLIPSSKPVISLPPLRENYVDIPGANGKIDLTDVLTGFPLYDMRSGEIDFIVDPAAWPIEVAAHEIANYVHGRKMRLILTDDPDWYYYGRISVSDPASSKEFSTIKFKYALDPIKMRVMDTPGFSDLVVDGSLVVQVPLSHTPFYTTPVIVSSAPMTVAIAREDGYSETANIAAVRAKYPAIVLAPGSNTLTFTGNGTVSIIFRGGSL